MKEIYDNILTLCSPEAKRIIKECIREHKKLKELEQDHFLYYREINSLVEKYGIKTNPEDYTSYFIELKNIKEENVNIRLFADGTVELKIPSLFKENLKAEISIAFNEIELYSNFHVIIYLENSVRKDMYDFSIVKNNSKTSDQEIQAHTFFKVDLKTFFPKSYSECNNEKIKNISEDIIKYFNDYKMFKDVVLLKYDTAVEEDDILSIIYSASELLSINKRNKNTLKIKS